MLWHELSKTFLPLQNPKRLSSKTKSRLGYPWATGGAGVEKALGITKDAIGKSISLSNTISMQGSGDEIYRCLEPIDPEDGLLG